MLTAHLICLPLPDWVAKSKGEVYISYVSYPNKTILRGMHNSFVYTCPVGQGFNRDANIASITKKNKPPQVLRYYAFKPDDSAEEKKALAEMDEEIMAKLLPTGGNR